jgi:predicted GNAT superfamily acetyltransferase
VTGRPVIRPARAEDYDRIVAVVDEWWGRPMQAKLPRLFLEHFSGTSLVADGEDGALAGFLVGFLSQDRPDEAYVHFVAVAPDARGGGLARELYERFFALAREAGRTRVRAITSPVNDGSIRFHRAMGFTLEDGEAERDGVPFMPDWDGPGEARVRFARRLDGDV